ncbi:MAG: hypothetical protein Aurels2KO_53170 [Aureliella sp.]
MRLRSIALLSGEFEVRYDSPLPKRLELPSDIVARSVPERDSIHDRENQRKKNLSVCPDDVLPRWFAHFLNAHIAYACELASMSQAQKVFAEVSAWQLKPINTSKKLANRLRVTDEQSGPQ